MKTILPLATLAFCALTTTRALADDKAACLEAANRGQEMSNAHELVGAREQFRVCAAAACPAVVQSDCANWLAEVEKALPTLVVAAKSVAGGDLADVKVSVDGQPFLSKLDGQAVPMNAGLHTFHFEGADGASLDQRVMVKEGEKNQSVAVVLGQSAALAPSGGGGSSIPWRTVGWIAGGVGVAGLAMGTVFGIVATSDKKSAHCMDNLCDPGTSSGIKSAALLSDVGWIAGGVLLAAGASLVLLAPNGKHEASATVKLSPVVTANRAGAVLGGSW